MPISIPMVLFAFSILLLLKFSFSHSSSSYLEFSDEKKVHYREKVKSMFYHAYNGYLEHAYPKDELRPLSCKGQDTWGSYSLTLVDSLDTLLILGNETEFERVSELVIQNLNVEKNINISVFETNIRIIGGLLSAHMLSSHAKDMTIPDGWPCSGPLLDLAEKFAQRLLPAFNTKTGMPFGTVNLKYGVNFLETPITCTAGIGTFLLEFGTLSRLTGNQLYERVALKALDALWKSRSTLGLVGNHIDVQTGIYTATDAGIGAGVDSYFEYLAKGALLFQRPNLMYQFNEFESAINQHIRRNDWFMWVDKDKATVSMPIFQSLESFWPGLLALLGRVEDAARIMATYGQVLRHLGLPPEFYNLPNREAMQGRAAYPLRPEIPESLMYLYRATRDPAYLHMAAGIVDTIDQIARTKCGFATVHDITAGSLEDRMESFFLAETIKYFYLIFDESNFMHFGGSEKAKLMETTDGPCIIEAGGWIFNTEAHPLDPGVIYCCSKKRQQDMAMLQEFEENINFFKLLGGNMQELEQEEEGEVDDEDEKIEESEKQENAHQSSISEQEEENFFDHSNGKQNNHFHVSSKNVQTSKFSKTILKFLENLESNDRNTEEGAMLLKDRMLSILEEMRKLTSRTESDGKQREKEQLICEECCTYLDKSPLGTSARAFWREIYINYLHFPFTSQQCLSSSETEIYEQGIESKYFNEPPEISSFQSEPKVLDGIKHYSLLKSTWIRHGKGRTVKEDEDFALLTTPNQSFDWNFLGIGQILGKRD